MHYLTARVGFNASTYVSPTRVPQRMMADAKAARVARIMVVRCMSESDVLHVLFMQGHGRKSANKVFAIVRGV